MSKMRRDVQWSFISIAISSFVHFLLRIVLGRDLGAYGLGLYTLIFSIYTLGIQFAGFGIGNALTKYIAENNGDIKKVNEFVSSGLVGSIISGFIVGAILYLFSDAIGAGIFHNLEMSGLLKITAICFPFIALQKTVLGTLNGLRKMNYFALLNIFQNILMVIVSIILVVFLKMEINGAILGLVYPTIFTGLFSLYFIKNHYIYMPRFFNSTSRELSVFGFYVVIASSIGVINAQIDSLAIGYFMNGVDVGNYAVAMILIQGILLLPSAIQQVTSPAMAEYYGKRNYQNIKNLMENVMLKTLLITIFLSGLLALFGRYVISFFFTDEFLPAYKPLLILLIGYSIQAPMISIGGWLASVGKVEMIFKISLFCVLINMILNVILIPRFGIIGAAIATSFSLVISVIISLGFIKKYVYDFVTECNNTSLLEVR